MVMSVRQIDTIVIYCFIRPSKLLDKWHYSTVNRKFACLSPARCELSFFSFAFYVGVWDVMSNQEVVDFVRKRIADHMKPQLVRITSWKGAT